MRKCKLQTLLSAVTGVYIRRKRFHRCLGIFKLPFEEGVVDIIVGDLDEY